jgi:hypothetical protein
LNKNLRITAGISKKLVTIFAHHLDRFIMTPSLAPFTNFIKPALDNSSNRDKFIFRRDLQKLRHGVLPAGIAYRLKNLDRWPAGLRHQRFLLIPATVGGHAKKTTS